MAAKKNSSGFTKKEEGMLLAMSTVLARASLARKLGSSYEGDRDIYTALGYPKILTFEDYRARYERDPVAKTIVDTPAKESWSKWPKIYEIDDQEETEFEAGIKEINKRLKLQKVFARLDRLMRLGEYAVLLLGVDDNGELSTELKRANKLLYATPYDEGDAAIKEYETNTKDPRYGLPKNYIIKTSLGESTSINHNVHHSRVIHVAEDCLRSGFRGIPQLKPPFNHLRGLELVSCGSPEMFWRGALPGYGFKADADATMTDKDMEALKDEIEEYMHQLKRYIRLKNVSVEDLAVQVVDPSNHVGVLIDLIACGVRIPKRILLGSERGELASSQDERNWLVQIKNRRELFCEPEILRPFIDKLVNIGVLKEPKDGYTVEWPDTLAPTEKEKADVGQLRSQALANYINAIGAESIVPPEIFWEHFLGLNESQVKMVREILEGEGNEE